jgi:hypothetical protein
MTVTPNSKIIYAEWKDSNAGDAGKKITFARSEALYQTPPFDLCGNFDQSMVNQTNNLTQMFSSKTSGRNTRVGELKHVYLEWNRDFIPTINSLRLGHINYYKLFTDY